RWPEVGPVPCLVKMLSPRAFARPSWPSFVNAAVVFAARPFVLMTATRMPAGIEVRRITTFDARFTALWDRVAPKFSFAVRRDAAYLQWKYVLLPHVRYQIAAV